MYVFYISKSKYTIMKQQSVFYPLPPNSVPTAFKNDMHMIG